MIRIIAMLFMLIFLNNCSTYEFYKQYKGNKLHKEQQKQLIENRKTWLNI